MPINFNPPLEDEIELSLFGPGVGEAICLHVGNGSWFLIDSCLNPSTKVPVAHEYLTALGLSPNEVVKQIIITHWHSDHVKGICNLIESCSRAVVITSSALQKKEFVTLLNVVSSGGLENLSTGLSELKGVFSLIKERIKLKSKEFPIKFVNGDQRILNTGDGVSVTTLSPSPSPLAVYHSQRFFSKELTAQTRRRRIIPVPTANLGSVALWIETPTVKILLGADLEVHKDSRSGWDAVIDSSGRPQGKATIVKIPHHGSKTGHCDRLWNEMIAENSLGLLTTFNSSNLPKPADIERLKFLTEKLFQTTPGTVKPSKKDPIVEKMIKASTKNRRVRFPPVGHIQVRIKQNGDVQVSHNDLAFEVI